MTTKYDLSAKFFHSSPDLKRNHSITQSAIQSVSQSIIITSKRNEAACVKDSPPLGKIRDRRKAKINSSGLHGFSHIKLIFKPFHVLLYN